MAPEGREEDQSARLLSEEESGVWEPTEKVPQRRSSVWWKIFLYPIIVAAIFLVGIVAGYHWQDADEDKRCMDHVSQKCQCSLCRI